MVILPALLGEKWACTRWGVVFLVLIGGELFGFSGIVFAVPIGAILQVILRYYWKKKIVNGFD